MKRYTKLIVACLIGSALCFAIQYSVVTYNDVITFNSDPRVNKPVSFWQWLFPVRDNS